jgi:hypothetical protein
VVSRVPPRAIGTASVSQNQLEELEKAKTEKKKAASSASTGGRSGPASKRIRASHGGPKEQTLRPRNIYHTTNRGSHVLAKINQGRSFTLNEWRRICRRGGAPRGTATLRLGSSVSLPLPLRTGFGGRLHLQDGWAEENDDRRLWQIGAGEERRSGSDEREQRKGEE